MTTTTALCGYRWWRLTVSRVGRYSTALGELPCDGEPLSAHACVEPASHDDPCPAVMADNSQHGYVHRCRCGANHRWEYPMSIPTTPAEALRLAADRWRREAVGINECPTEAMLDGWADELDGAGPWAEPPEPPEHLREVWDCRGSRWERVDTTDIARWRHAAWPTRVVAWHELLVYGPLSATPPAGTERPIPPELATARIKFWVCPVPGHRDRRGPNGELVGTVEWDGDVAYCLTPGCLRSSQDPPEGRGTCECELYDCESGCCGAGQCSCTTPPAGTEAS